MSRNYDSWERLVRAVVKREQIRQLFHENSRTPSISSESSKSDLSSRSSSSLSEMSYCRSSSNLRSPSSFNGVLVVLSGPRSSSRSEKRIKEAYATSHILYPKQKVVFKLLILGEKDGRKAVKAVSRFPGIESVDIDVKEQRLTVVGQFDPTQVVKKLRKSWFTDIVNVEKLSS